ncbi:hypothetical protein RHMOL_Rhmol01G0169200 [Rhododendron molle]|uniref:Uncharacterized protein n=1 Tax=Rhododendron molle TaxID=49168 RepID=A0ACC0Q3N8_RHOML|nr:hypothetical protein RHMOL_Rhmol01G0169200 [Rhododendron molle]
MSQLVQTKLNIPEELSASIIQNGNLNIVRLIELYGPEGALGDYVGQTHRSFVLLVCMLAAYMLIPVDEEVNPSIVSIALQMDTRKNIMPTVLAETLIGLDLVKSGQANKVGVLEAPEAGFEHFPRQLVERPMVYPELMIEEWYAFLNDMQSEDIVWRCPWLNLPAMTVNSARFKRVIFAGLASFTFYIPGRTLRQLGTSQESRRFGRERFGLPTFDGHNLQAYEYSWTNRELEEPLPDPITWLESWDISHPFGYKRAIALRMQDTSFTEHLTYHTQMANHLPALIDTWLETFAATDWLSFRTHGLVAFHFFRSIRLWPEILQSAVWFWDPGVHVFRFRDNELCPTAEEFQAYLQGFASNVIIVPPYRKNMSKLLKTSLNITSGAAESLLSGEQINVMRLMEWYRPEGDTGDMALQARRWFALVISVLAAYLLVSSNG